MEKEICFISPKRKAEGVCKGRHRRPGWSSRNGAPSPLLPLQISLDLVWIHQTQYRDLYPLMLPVSPRGPGEELQRDSIHGKAAPGAWKSTQQWGSWQEGNAFPPSHPFQAVGRARRRRGAAGRAKVTAACSVVTVSQDWGWWQEPPGAAAGASGWWDPPRLGKTMGSTGNGNTAQPLTTPQFQNELLVTPAVLVTPPAQLWCPLSCSSSVVPSQG